VIAARKFKQYIMPLYFAIGFEPGYEAVEDAQAAGMNIKSALNEVEIRAIKNEQSRRRRRAKYANIGTSSENRIDGVSYHMRCLFTECNLTSKSGMVAIKASLHCIARAWHLLNIAGECPAKALSKRE
jgi:hypothetical protein